MQDATHAEAQTMPELVPFLPHWHVREVSRDGATVYEVRDCNGVVVASDVKSLEHARLFALAPLMFENFKRLEAEAIRGLWHMVDANAGDFEVEEVADDVDGRFESASPVAPEHARWLMEVGALREAVGEQAFPPVGVPRQLALALNS
ncbi:hypothetical protein [Hydrogenophaga laconesensis]|jgi:hypothetical protein|uniref:Uncharacterized protein n=1 Tax=Hydrogenophaga laconesensis TaxID=1805971 RepID=A0ABU1V920_9BURK|nr:hypothetical protein [Hydrogenophaga laconesensis]MDR7093944.1 hypothetical protein [Hydrogenophaga laconesensis]